MANERFADLHLHTTHSDSTLTPQALVAEACAAGLHAIAITDHDTVRGVDEAFAAAAPLDMRVIPGAELTAYHRGRELHVVGLFIDAHNPVLLETLQALHAARRERVKEIARKLARLGAPIDAEKIIADASGTVGRSHVAQELIAAGHADTVGEAFAHYIGQGAAAYVPKLPWTTEHIVRLIHRAGGVAVLAHPANYQMDAELLAILHGFDGLEVYCPGYTAADTERYRRTAEQLGLALSGGSDDHGLIKEGRLLGQIRLPLHFVDDLERRRPAG